MNKTISITVDVEEWFHTEWFNVEKIINTYYDGKYPKTDVVDCVKNLIELFDRYAVNATFFVLGETIERYPNLIHIIKNHNHEIACHSYYHNKKYGDIESFKEDIKKFKKDIYSDAMGFRFPNYKTSNELFKIIKVEEFSYDSSIVPCRKIPGWYGGSNFPINPFFYKLPVNLSHHPLDFE